MAEAQEILKRSIGQIEQPGNINQPGGHWCIVELMGHVRLGGYVTEEERFGAKLGRIDVPTKAGGFETQYFGGGAVYRITPVDEGIARSVALDTQYAPVRAWQALNQSAGGPSVTVDTYELLEGEEQPEGFPAPRMGR